MLSKQMVTLAQLNNEQQFWSIAPLAGHCSFRQRSFKICCICKLKRRLAADVDKEDANNNKCCKRVGGDELTTTPLTLGKKKRCFHKPITAVYCPGSYLSVEASLSCQLLMKSVKQGHNGQKMYDSLTLLVSQ
mmetsp:Transcript_17508/g.26786  ORF Transcript_17508/g.26786 Transcript_17508/m.26786 type:complete len:133 (+) Transcript_17508:897-1295(+)